MRCGIFASAHHAAGGGGATVSAVETIVRPSTTSGSQTVDITTTLLTTDRVVIVVQKGTSTATPTPSGLGATWSTDVVNSSSIDFYVFSGSGVTGSGTVTISGLSTQAAFVTAFVLRSSTGTAVTFQNGNVNIGATAGEGTLATTTDTAAAGAFVIGSGWLQTGTPTFPHGSTTPASGWSTVRDTTAGTAVNKVIAQTLASSASVGLVISPDVNASAAVARAAYIP